MCRTAFIPRTRLPETLRCIEAVSRKYDLQNRQYFSTPVMAIFIRSFYFDERDPEQFKRVNRGGPGNYEALRLGRRRR